MARTRSRVDRDPALALSEAMGGLPLAHEQAAAYCERVGISLADYLKRFRTVPASMLDDPMDASLAYHDGRTVAKTFALAIEEAGKLHPAAEPLIAYAAQLAPEPIPLYLFSEGRIFFSEPLASAIEGNGLDEGVAALRAFALVDRERIQDERDPSIETDSIRLHRLVLEVAAARTPSDLQMDIRRHLLEALMRIYPDDVFHNPDVWPRARRLDAICIELVKENSTLPEGTGGQVSWILDRLATYRQAALVAHADARPLFERALAISEALFGIDHLDTAPSLSNLAHLLQLQGDFAGALSYFERALAINEKELAPDHSDNAFCLDGIGMTHGLQNNFDAARQFHERALAIREKTLGPDHPITALSLNNVGYVLKEQGDYLGARKYFERALAIYEKELVPYHLDKATTLNNLGYLFEKNGDLGGARTYFERALTIRTRALGPNHPNTKDVAKSAVRVLNEFGLANEARVLVQEYGLNDEE